MRTPAIVSIVIVVGAAIGGGCGSGTPEVQPGADGEVDPVLVTGRAVFTARCRGCHGDAGGGVTGPNIKGEGVTERYPDIVDQMEVVSEGRGGMPAFAAALTPEEIEAVVRYTREVL